MNTDSHLQPEELEAKLSLKKAYLRAALAISGGAQSSPAATKVAGNEAAALKTEIASIEQKLASLAKAA